MLNKLLTVFISLIILLGWCWLAEFMQEVGHELIFTVFELLLGETSVVEDWDIESILLALEHVQVEDVDDPGAILPRPRPKDSWSINGVGLHVVVHKRVEVLERHLTHDSPHAFELQLGLSLHLLDQVLSVLQLELELLLLLSIQIWSPLLEVRSSV